MQVVAGLQHTCALLSGGSVRCWGLGEHGQLGYGDYEDVLSPSDRSSGVRLDGQDARALQVSAGETHTCALLEGGDVRCWGEGENGRLGYGDEFDVEDPSRRLSV